MAHPEYNIQQTLNGTQHLEVRLNGNIIQQQTLVKAKTRTADHAGASTNNPVGSDGTRRMAGYARRGGVRTGVVGLLKRKYITVGGDLSETVYRGVLARPGTFPGSITYPFPQGRIEAIRSALGNFGENEVQLGAALQEVRQTTDMVGKYYTRASQLTYKLESAVRGSKRVRNSMRSFLRNGWRDAPSAYLEYLFGMKPLGDDISNAMTVLQDTQEKRGAFLLVLRGRFDRSDSFRSNAFLVPDAGPLSNILQDVRVSQKQKATLRFLLPEWYWERLPPVTPFRQAWETARLSFVLDWVLPVSSWLSGFEGLQLRPFFKDGCVSSMLRRSVSGAFWHDTTGQWTFVPEGAGGEDYSFQREVLSAFPTGDLFALPRLKSELGLNQLRVGSALLGQRIAKLQSAIY